MPSKVIGWIFLECTHQKALDLNREGPTSLVKLESRCFFFPLNPSIWLRRSGEDSGGFGCPFLIHHVSSDLCCAGCTFESFADGLPHGWTNYFTSSDPHHDMLGGGCQVRVVIENMMGRMENLRTLISGFLGLVILVRWALVTMFLSWTTQTGCRIHRTYVSLIGSGEGRHTTHLLKCVLLLSTSQTDWKQSSDVLSDISFDILSDISSDIFFWYIFWHSFWHIFWHSFWHLSDISFDILSDKSFDTLAIFWHIFLTYLSDISFDMLSDISSDILSDISKPKPNIHSFTQKAALQTLYLPHTTQQK